QGSARGTTPESLSSTAGSCRASGAPSLSVSCSPCLRTAQYAQARPLSFRGASLACSAGLWLSRSQSGYFWPAPLSAFAPLRSRVRSAIVIAWSTLNILAGSLGGAADPALVENSSGLFLDK